MFQTFISIKIAILVLLISSFSVSAATNTNSIFWAGCGITKKAFMSELAKGFELRTGIKIVLQGGGATKGIRKVSSGELYIGGACRVALENHPLERNAYQVPVAWDALVVIVNKRNRVQNITIQQIQQIYNGKITNWKSLGGRDAPIDLYVRRGKLSGVGRTLRELVFADFNHNFKGAKYVEKSSGPLEKGILNNWNGIGVTGISSARKRDVKILALQGIKPSYDNIKNGSYLLYRPLYLVRQRNAVNPVVNQFIKFALSKRGKDIIRKAGTVPYSDAMVLVMKQLEQYRKADQAGLNK